MVYLPAILEYCTNLFEHFGECDIHNRIQIYLLLSARPSLFLETSQILDSPAAKPLDVYTLVHQLFVRAHTDLQLPHLRFAMTEVEYVAWIESRSREEWSNMIRETIRLYVEDVNKRGGKEFTPEYSLLLKVLQ